MNFKKITALGMLTCFTVTSCSSIKTASNSSIETKRKIASDETNTGIEVYRFGGACPTQGAWTRMAQAETATLANTINRIKDNPNCSGLKTISNKLNEIQVNQGLFDFSKGHSATNIKADWNVLRNIFTNSEFKDAEKARSKEFADGQKAMLAKHDKSKSAANDDDGFAIYDDNGKAVGSTAPKEEDYYESYNVEQTPKSTIISRLLNASAAGKLANIAERANRVSKTALDLVDVYTEALPSLDTCIGYDSKSAGMILSSVIKLTAAAVSEDEGSSGFNTLANKIAKITTQLQERKYTKALKLLAQQEFSDSVNCLLESTTNLYCNAIDARQMVAELNKKEKDMQSSRSIYAGYNVLTQHLPTLSSWLNTFLSAGPRTSTEANKRANAAKANLAAMQSLEFDLRVETADLLSRLEANAGSLNENSTKREVVQYISSVLDKINYSSGNTRASSDGPFAASSGEGAQNFFETNDLPNKVFPFYLLNGSKLVPAACDPAITKSTTERKNWDDWIILTNEANSSFQAPVKTLINQIQERAIGMIRNGVAAAGAYTANLRFPNKTKLVTDVIRPLDSDPRNVTMKSMELILAYLDAFIARCEAYGDNANLIKARAEVLKENFDETIKSFKLALVAKNENDPAVDKAIGNVVGFFDVYSSMSPDTVVRTYLTDIVKFDFSVLSAKHPKGQEMIMTAAGKTYLDILMSGANMKDRNGFDIDTSNAMRILKNNLKAIEQAFSKDFKEILSETKKVAFNETTGIFFKTYRRDNSAHSAIKNYSQSCINILAFDGKKNYWDVCKHSRWLPDQEIVNYTDRELYKYDLFVNFDEYARGEFKPIPGSKAMKAELDNLTTDDSICASRNYLRRVQVYELMKSLGHE